VFKNRPGSSFVRFLLEDTPQDSLGSCQEGGESAIISAYNLHCRFALSVIFHCNVLKVSPDIPQNVSIQSNFDNRDSLEREKAYARENFCAFRLVSQAEYLAGNLREICGSFTRIVTPPAYRSSTVYACPPPPLLPTKNDLHQVLLHGCRLRSQLQAK
jgi:hypothetical protein